MAVYKYINGEHRWYFNGKLHNEVGPAVISGDAEEWHKNGELHRLDGPALKYSYINSITGVKWFVEEWLINDKSHRLDGPSRIEYTLSGEIYEEWHINGIKFVN